MGPPKSTYATVFYGVFEFFLLKRFGNNLLMYRLFIDNVLVLLKRYENDRAAADLWDFQENIQEWYGLEWTFKGPMLRLDFMDLTIAIKESMINTNLFKNNSIYTYTSHHIQLTHQESSTGSSMDIFIASPPCVLKNRTRKA